MTSHQLSTHHFDFEVLLVHGQMAFTATSTIPPKEGDTLIIHRSTEPGKESYDRSVLALITDCNCINMESNPKKYSIYCELMEDQSNLLNTIVRP